MRQIQLQQFHQDGQSERESEEQRQQWREDMRHTEVESYGNDMEGLKPEDAVAIEARLSTVSINPTNSDLVYYSVPLNSILNILKH